ncbi:alpha/beta fold hydrolase [uncultured Roseobacter sp.]|uniref:alpha/beta fold hydrolase n=1 Tax=uncultured Roseobacter sp. TaxID=114847 RepID=UPI00260D13A5|nr:alpha/beta fold hydrolase [uncultured Roseobacter sp.]
MNEPLVLLPGLMCDARLFGPQIAELSADTAVTIAPVTQGERIEEIASGLLDQLPARFALAGAGLGGMVAMELMRRAPDRVRRLALIGTNPHAETPQAAAAREPLIVAARSGRLREIMQDQIIPRYAGGLELDPELAALMLDMAEVSGAEVFLRQSRVLQRRRDQQRTLCQCKVPALVLCGAQDALFPVERHSFMAELIPNAQLVVLDGSGHLPTLEQPAETTRALRHWLSQPRTIGSFRQTAESIRPST